MAIRLSKDAADPVEFMMSKKADQKGHLLESPKKRECNLLQVTCAADRP
jgi:hypothetical protein